MQPDEEICLCYHVTRRKLVNFVTYQKPRVASQLSECLGAGTGCGWCRKTLTRLIDEVNGGVDLVPEPTAEEYARMRARYIREGGGTPPPGATPIDS